MQPIAIKTCLCASALEDPRVNCVADQDSLLKVGGIFNDCVSMLESLLDDYPSHSFESTSCQVSATCNMPSYGAAAVLALLSATGQAKDIYVSPSGTGTGTSTSPYGSIQSAVNAAAAGDVIYLRAGTYKPTTNIQITKSGTRTQPITLRSFEKEKVILDGEGLPG